MFVRECAARALRSFAALALVAISSAPASAADALLYRIFLRDGTSLVSYGDFTRVADRVVFSIPVGGDDAAPALHLVTIAESAVDWDRTHRYAEAIRAKRYAATRGEQDFDALSTQVALALNEVARTKDPARRVLLANDARRMLAAWPAAHYGYRASDVAQLSAMLDEAVSELRVAAGQSRFDLDLVATAEQTRAYVPELPPPTLRDSIEQLFAVAAMSSEPTERLAMFETIVDRMKQPADNAPWRASMYAKALAELSIETKTERNYKDLVAKTIAAADEFARRADVNGIAALVKSVLTADDRLGRRRPQTTASLLATLDARLDSARRLRLARDAWAVRQEGLALYQRRIRVALDRFRRSIAGLEEIRGLAGPAPTLLPRLAQRVTEAWKELKVIRPPAEAEAVHGMLIGAMQMAVRAASSRQMAINATDMNTAWEASAAAAGALLMFERAQEELRKLTTPPAL